MYQEMEIGADIMKDVIEWDVYNWGRAVSEWAKEIDFFSLKGKKVLDLGGRHGGLSLLFALYGATVICSDLDFVSKGGTEMAKSLHKKYGVEALVEYEDIDATNIPYCNEFDIICFKSILGGIGRNNNFPMKQKVSDEIYKALKQGGYLVFVENLTGTKLIKALREFIRPWGKSWSYLCENEIKVLFEKYEICYIKSFGVIGLLGRKEPFSYILSLVDKCLEKVVADDGRYIASCVCQKIN